MTTWKTGQTELFCSPSVLWYRTVWRLMNAKFIAAKMPVALQHSFKLDFYSWDLISKGKILILSYLWCSFQNTSVPPSFSRCQNSSTEQSCNAATGYFSTHWQGNAWLKLNTTKSLYKKRLYYAKKNDKDFLIAWSAYSCTPLPQYRQHMHFPVLPKSHLNCVKIDLKIVELWQFHF